MGQSFSRKILDYTGTDPHLVPIAPEESLRGPPEAWRRQLAQEDEDTEMEMPKASILTERGRERGM